MVERSEIVTPPTPFRSVVAAASAKPTRYSRAIPRFEPQAPPPAVELGWLVLKNTVPATLVALEITFSPPPRMIFQPFSPSGSVPLTSAALLASNTSASVRGEPVGEVEKPDILTEVELVAPLRLPAAELSRSLSM